MSFGWKDFWYDVKHIWYQKNEFHWFQKISTKIKTPMLDKPLNWLTFLLKLNAIDTHHSVNKIGKVTEALQSSVVTLFRSPYEIDVYPRRKVRIFSNIMGPKCGKYMVCFGKHFFLFFFSSGEFSMHEMHLFAFRTSKAI